MSTDSVFRDLYLEAQIHTPGKLEITGTAMHLVHVDMCCLQDSSRALVAVSSLLHTCLPSWSRQLLFETGLNNDDEGSFAWPKHYVFLFEYGSIACPELALRELRGTD